MAKQSKGGNSAGGSGEILNGQQLARYFGTSRQTITAWDRSGMPRYDEKGPRGSPRYNSAVCVDWKIDQEIKRRTKSSPDNDDDLEIEEIRRRAELAKMKQAEIELAVTEERFGDIEAILLELSNSLSTIRSTLIALPKIAPQLEHMDALAVEQRLEEEVYRVLNELADFTVEAEENDD